MRSSFLVTFSFILLNISMNCLCCCSPITYFRLLFDIAVPFRVAASAPAPKPPSNAPRPIVRWLHSLPAFVFGLSAMVLGLASAEISLRIDEDPGLFGLNWLSPTVVLLLVRLGFLERPPLCCSSSSTVLDEWPLFLRSVISISFELFRGNFMCDLLP